MLADAWVALGSGASGDLAAYEPAMIRIDIPWRFAGEILKTLATMGHSAAEYFPGYAGAANAVMDLEYWP